MLTPQEIQQRLNHILPKVRTPGRYTGGELNQVVKDWGAVKTKIALVFPEIYDLAMSNVGIAVLYDLLNKEPDLAAERVFLPWTDMQNAMREADVPLYSLETKHPLTDFDMIGVSLPYEALYTNFLSVLDLGGVPLRSSQRTAEHPLVIAGGHACFNPEPVAPFLDAVVIGEGEEVLLEIARCYQAHQTCQRTVDWKSQLLKALAGIPGVYVPSLYKAHYHPDGVFSHLEPQAEEAPETILKRVVGQLPPAPTRLIVPYVDTVHNRAPIEIMRGCTRGCRFCHAGMINRPVRERSVEETLQTIDEIISETGYSEIGLLSLSSSDYTKVVELVEAISETYQGQNITLSLPSLRIETLSVELMDALSDQRRGGFTLAPEAGSERLRRIINKSISDQQVLDIAHEIYSRGWHTIKLYFMIGHPTETREDVQAIADLCRAVRDEGEKQIGKRAQVHASVGTFVPKPHTPFQWVSCASIPDIKAKIDLLQKELRGWGLKFNWNDPQTTHLEAWLSRGDRRMAEVILTAWQNGAQFDAWHEHFNNQRWLDAFQASGLDPNFYTTRERSLKEAFPWDHIHPGVDKSFLKDDFRLSLEGKTRPDCREHCCACGILTAFNDLRRANPEASWGCPEVK
jgi:radical SAM family uncharacterized protein